MIVPLILTTALLNFNVILPQCENCESCGIAEESPRLMLMQSSEEQDSVSEEAMQVYIYSAGSRYVMQRTLRELLEIEAERRKSAGEWVGYKEITEEEINTELQKRRDMVLAQDPSFDFWAQVRAQGFTENTFRDELRRNMQAREMFFPLDPEEWPVEQLKVILSDSWDQFLSADHQTLLEKKEAGEFQPLNDQVLMTFLMPTVWKYLIDQAQISYPSDGLPEGIALRINNRDIKTEEMFNIIEPMISPIGKKWADSFALNMKLATEDLKSQGVWLTDEEYLAKLNVERADYEGTIIPHEMMIMQFLGFPSMELYYQYFRARHSYRKLLPEDESEEYLKLVAEMIDTHGSFYNADRVQVDVILLGARDKNTGSFPMSGDSYVEAEERALEVAELLEAEDANWDEILLDYSDYPETVNNNANPQLPQPKRGRLPEQSRNDLRGFLMENDYTDFVMLSNMADKVYYEAEIGQVYGPYKNALGYSFFKVNNRTKGSKGIDYDNNERDRFVVNDDLLTTKFHAYVNELRQK